MKTMQEKYPVQWCGDPGNCDGCHKPIDTFDRFYDAKTRRGPWGKFCPACAVRFCQVSWPSDAQIPTVQTGTGIGQCYMKCIVYQTPADGSTETRHIEWRKIAG